MDFSQLVSSAVAAAILAAVALSVAIFVGLKVRSAARARAGQVEQDRPDDFLYFVRYVPGRPEEEQDDGVR